MKIAGQARQRSAFGPEETTTRLVAAVEAHRMMVFARIDHRAAAAQAGLTLGPTFVVIFGDPRTATPLMQVTRTMALDLPHRVLIWQDQSGATWLAYNDPEWLLRRHGIDPSADPARAMASAFLGCVQKALTP